VTLSSEVFLGVIALATLVMAVIQVSALVFAGRLAARIDRLAAQVEQEIKPLLASLVEVGENARRTTSLAAAQAERADRVFADVARRVDETIAVLQNSLVAPAREGRALLVAVRAALEAFRELRAARARSLRHEDEDALFIG
jgi:hypothetical protein